MLTSTLLFLQPTPEPTFVRVEASNSSGIEMIGERPVLFGLKETAEEMLSDLGYSPNDTMGLVCTVTVEKMVEFSMDHANGPGPNSICRHGVHFSEETSLAAGVMEINPEQPEKSTISLALGKPCHAWRAAEAHITLEMTMGPEDIPEGLRSGEIWKRYYTEEPHV